MKIHQKRQAILQVSEMIFYETQHQLIYGFDETILTKFIWPLAIDDAVFIFVTHSPMTEQIVVVYTTGQRVSQHVAKEQNTPVKLFINFTVPYRNLALKYADRLIIVIGSTVDLKYHIKSCWFKNTNCKYIELRLLFIYCKFVWFIQPKDGNIKSLVLVKVCRERLKYDDKKEENEEEMPLR